MADSSKDSIRINLERRISQVDKFLDSPSKNASDLMEMFPTAGLTAWELVCFCNEVLTNLAATHSFLIEPIRQLNNLVYLYHYLAADKLGILDTEEQRKQWDILIQSEQSKELRAISEKLKSV